ncbi:MAG: aminoacyl-tRNA hydrolase [Pirellulaceae bacterium]|jgi:ribosome-associated protein|nr:aminoacyl-tRNA hydrolase [Pirellulaceae bacterium]
MLVVDAHIRIPRQELRRTTTRSSGPGGQNVNKVNSKVTLHWDVGHSPSLPDDVRERFLQRYRARLTARGELVLHSQRYRDQPRNWEDCLDRLRQLILAVRQPPVRRRATKPSGASRQRRLQGKSHTAQKKRLRQRPSAAD